MSSGSVVDELDVKIDPNSLYQGRTALTGGAQTIALGAAYRNFHLWLDTGASACHVLINPDGTTTAADANDPKITDGDSYKRSLQTGVSILYIFSTGAAGSINVEAW